MIAAELDVAEHSNKDFGKQEQHQSDDFEKQELNFAALSIEIVLAAAAAASVVVVVDGKSDNSVSSAA